MKIELTTQWPRERIDAAWPEVKRCLQMFVDRYPTDETLTNVIAKILQGALQLWLIEDDGRVVMAVLTRLEINEATGKKQCQVYALGGERGEDVMSCLRDIEEWARAKGFDEMEITGRRGWRKRLSAQGWRSTFELYRKSLKGEGHGQAAR